MPKRQKLCSGLLLCFFWEIRKTLLTLWTLGQRRKENRIMTTMELDARRAEIIRQLFATDSMEVLDSVKRSLTCALNRHSKEEAVEEEELTPYTMEEINRRLDEGEEEEAAGLVYTHEEVMAEIRKHIAAI